MNPVEVAFFWFRRDLRLEDNVGLFYALESKYPVIPLFIFDEIFSQKYKHFLHYSRSKNGRSQLFSFFSGLSDNNMKYVNLRESSKLSITIFLKVFQIFFLFKLIFYLKKMVFTRPKK